MSEASGGPGWWQASDGKWYPPQQQQPAQQPAPPTVVQKKGGCFRWIGIAVVAFVGLVVLLVIVVAATGGGSSKKAPSAISPSQATYTIGQTAHTGDFDVTLDTVENPYKPTNQFETPEAGQHFVALELTVKNNATEAKTMSTLLGAELQDSQSRPWGVALAGTNLPQLDGKVAVGESRRGWVVFNVADDAAGLKLRLKGNLTATGSVFVIG